MVGCVSQRRSRPVNIHFELVYINAMISWEKAPQYIGTTMYVKSKVWCVAICVLVATSVVSAQTTTEESTTTTTADCTAHTEPVCNKTAGCGWTGDDSDCQDCSTFEEEACKTYSCCSWDADASGSGSGSVSGSGTEGVCGPGSCDTETTDDSLSPLAIILISVFGSLLGLFVIYQIYINVAKSTTQQGKFGLLTPFL